MFKNLQILINYQVNKQNLTKNFLCVYKTNKRSYAKVTAKPNQPKYESVIGLEIHAQIATKSKLFSGAAAQFAASANTCVSNFDAAIPGTLPVLNKKCVEFGVKTALALNCRINPISMFDRKHYFYADLPAGYQITQQRAPLASDGNISFYVFVPGKTKKPYKKSVRLHQLQLEQDSGKSLHDSEAKKSLVDLNRAGQPLMELVFDPNLSSGEEASSLLKELILILTKLETCSCKMEEGALRIDANISINKPGEPLGIRTEVKNIGSIHGVADSITYEIERQIQVLETGGIIQNETRAWDAISGKTIPMRDKEVQQDYRFMPEPNLPPLRLIVDENSPKIPGLIDVALIKEQIPELPEVTRQKLVTDYGLTYDVAVILMNDQNLLRFFLDIIQSNSAVSSKTVSNFLINDLLKLCNKNNIDIGEIQITSTQLLELFEMLQHEIINLNLAKSILNEMLLSPQKSPKMIANEKNFKQIKNIDEITKMCEEILAENPKLVIQYKKGKEKVLFAMAGEIFKRTEQRANMAMVVEKLKELLSQM